MGGAQAQAITFNGGVGLLVEVDKWRIDRRLQLKQVDLATESLDEALDWVKEFTGKRAAKSIALLGNAAEIHWELLQRNVLPMSSPTRLPRTMFYTVTFPKIYQSNRQTNSENPAKPNTKSERRIRWRGTSKRCSNFKRRGAIVFDYGNNLRQRAKDNGVENAFDYPGFVPAYIRPLFCEGKGPFRWVALSGEREDIYKTDEAIMNLFPDNDHLARWLTMAQEQVEFQGLPARICWLGYGERARAGLKLNEMVASGELKAPIVIGRDHLDCGSVASPNRETEAMKDGSDAIADWVYLNAMINAVSGATWVSIHHGGGVGHRLFAPRRTSHRRRRHARSRETH
jgi:urocanate hydratase